MGKTLPVIVNDDLMPTASNPQSWLPLMGGQPGEPDPGGIRITYGNMTPRYRGFSPSIVAYARAKMMVAAPPGTPDWTMTAHRAQVYLPRHADERWTCPRTLFEEVERADLGDDGAVAACITMRWKPARLQEQFWLGQEVATWLARTSHVPVLMIQHVPQLSNAHPHLHLIAGMRRITEWGTVGCRVAALCRPTSRALIVDRVAAILNGTAG